MDKIAVTLGKDDLDRVLRALASTADNLVVAYNDTRLGGIETQVALAAEIDRLRQLRRDLAAKRFRGGDL